MTIIEILKLNPNKIRRKAWVSGCYIKPNVGFFYYYDNTLFNFHVTDLTATDWEIYNA